MTDISAFDYLMQMEGAVASAPVASNPRPDTVITVPNDIRRLLAELANQIPESQLPRSARKFRKELDDKNCKMIFGDYDVERPNLLGCLPTRAWHLQVLADIVGVNSNSSVVHKIRNMMLADDNAGRT